MRGKLAKRIRNYVKRTYKFLSDTPLYMQRANGQIYLAQQCKRAISQAMKRQYARRKANV